MKIKSLIASILILAASAVSAAAPQIKELNISYVKPPFVLQLLVMKDRQMLEKEFEKEGIKVNWHNMGTSPEAARSMGAGSLDIAGNMNTACTHAEFRGSACAHSDRHCSSNLKLCHCVQTRYASDN